MAFCANHGITHQQCSVEHHESIGTAERAVRTCKQLIRKCKLEKSCWALALYYLNMTPRANGLSPSDLLLKRRPNTLLPDLRLDPTQEEIEEVAELREARELERHAQTGNRKVLSKLEVGDRVKVWNNTSKKFNREWKVVAARESRRSYILRDKVTDRVYMRNRRHLYPCTAPAPVNIVMSNPPKNLKTALKTKLLRRGQQ